MFFKKNCLFHFQNVWLKPIRRYIWLSNHNNQINSVKLAYNSYENTGIKYDVAPVLILHGLYGSKKNFKTMARTLNEVLKPKRKV